MLADTLIEKHTKQTRRPERNTAVHELVDMNALAIKKAKELVAFIKQNCKMYLQQGLGNRVFYRGTRNAPKEKNHVAFVRKVRSDRKPRDSSVLLHNAFNTLIGLAGKVANRTNSVFATSSTHAALEYGPMYVILPIGNFHYTWSTEWDDWVNAEDPSRVIALAVEDSKHAARIQELNKTIEAMTKECRTLSFGSKKRYKIGRERERLEVIQRRLTNMVAKEAIAKKAILPNLTKVLKGDDGSLEQAARSQHEVLFSCASALYINRAFYQEFVQPILLGKAPTKSFGPHHIGGSQY